MKHRFLVLILVTFSVGMAAQKISIDPEISMLVLGDSYSIGESVEEKQRWPNQFVVALRELGIEANEPDYIATTGWTTTQLIQGIDKYLNREKRYNLVSILIGVNNQYQGIDISTYEPDLTKIVDKALDVLKQDSSKIFMLSIPDYAFTPFGDGKPSISNEIDAYNAINKRVAAKYNICYIDITPLSRTGLNNPSLVAGDGLHPSGLQYGEWVQKVLPLLDLF
ncbi:MAG: SGNH/GDSL hydrolase family protein [Bacteroides sp.]|nr:SGNH/GDSL hydrolase family protein [Bacteroides sp.]